MAGDRGLPPIPRGLQRELAVYLQSLSEAVGRLSGVARGSAETRAVRVSETSAVVIGGSAPAGSDSVTNGMLRDGSVTERKLATGAVTSGKLAQGSVDSSHLGRGCVTADKVSTGVLPVWRTGTARDGETVTMEDDWAETPMVALVALKLAKFPAEAGPLTLGLTKPRKDQETGQWMFDARGDCTWVAWGYLN